MYKLQFIGEFHGFKLLFNYALREASPWGEAPAFAGDEGLWHKENSPSSVGKPTPSPQGEG